MPVSHLICASNMKILTVVQEKWLKIFKIHEKDKNSCDTTRYTILSRDFNFYFQSYCVVAQFCVLRDKESLKRFRITAGFRIPRMWSLRRRDILCAWKYSYTKSVLKSTSSRLPVYLLMVMSSSVSGYCLIAWFPDGLNVTVLMSFLACDVPSLGTNVNH